MPFKVNVKGDMIKYRTLASEGRGTWVSTVADQPKKTIWESTDLLVRLNELANARPFNIMYRVKKYDPL
jgi:hypothetical protein